MNPDEVARSLSIAGEKTTTCLVPLTLPNVGGKRATSISIRRKDNSLGRAMSL
jgi:hypothetical protein